MFDKNWDIVIIGAGPAGMAAAIQLFRYGFRPLIFEAAGAGGLLPGANLVENYPGFPKGIPGRELAQLFVEQFNACNPEIIYDKVIKADWQDGLFIMTSRNEEISAEYLIIATGTKPKEYKPLPKPVRDRVFYDIAALLNEKEKHIVIIGAGDIAFDYALNLARNNSVTILNRGDKIKALPLLDERIRENKFVTYMDQVNLVDFASNEKNQVLLKYNKNGAGRLLKADFVVFAIGRLPDLDFLSHNLEVHKDILVDEGRLYLIGDVKNGIFRQTSIAVGQAIESAMKLYHSIKG